MKVYVIVVLTLITLGASEVDEELEEKLMTLSRSNFVQHFNKKNYSWKIKQYTNINITLNMRFGVQNLPIDRLPVKLIAPETVSVPLPESFDARKRWPHCFSISKVRYQHHCGSCWAHGVADVASDRLCINSGRQIELSIQDLECSHTHQTICYGGFPSNGFEFWKGHGLVPEECKPYEPFDLNRNTCVRFCKYNPLLKDYLDKKIHATEVHGVLNDSWQIKAELFLNGPIQALMPVYEDFQHFNGNGYYSGIYEHKYGQLIGLHAVRVIGYGVEDGVEYWLAANSWGPEWGEGGFFRIKSFQPDIGFELSMNTGTPRLDF